MGRWILERERELAELADAARGAAAGDGCVVLVYGEAGIGKSSMVEAVRGRLPAEGRMLVGHCDDLATARVLGPFRDLAGSVGADLTAALTGGADRDRILAALRSELDWSGHPTVLAIEDVHWADDATLDVLRYLVRRIGQLPVVLILTYRDDELDREHPLRQLLGLVAGSDRTRRLPLRRLSPEAVRELSTGSGVDAAEVFAVTSGNPFFVSEVLASEAAAGVPRTVVDAVLARLRGLDDATRDAVEQLSVVPSTIDRWLVEAVVPGGLATLSAAEERGLLAVTPRRVAFRHELTRRAIADALPAARRTALNGQLLATLVEHGGVDLSELVHHAAEAGDQAAVVRYGPAAARAAATSGAHREAGAHYRLLLQLRELFEPAELAELLEQSVIERYITGDQGGSAVPDQEEAVALRRALDDPVSLGGSLRWLSRIRWWQGDRPGAEVAAREAVDVLVNAGDRRMLAMAYSNQAQLDMLADRNFEAIAAAERAIALARDSGDAAVLSHALNNLGTAKWDLNDPGGREALAESLQVALDAGETDHACRAYVNTIWQLLDERRPAEAATYLPDAMDLAEKAEQTVFLQYLHVVRGRIELAAGRWQEATREAEHGLTANGPVRCAALTVTTRAAVRRGRATEALLADAWQLAAELAELQRTGPAASAICEAAWLRGDLETVRRTAAPVHEEARRRNQRLIQPELAYWLAKAGEHVEPLAEDDPYALQLAGRWRDAAKLWEDLGYPYERAAALADSEDPADLLEALTELDALGAVPLAQLVRRRLRELGVTGIPRGPAASTRQNLAGLTRRQLEVLRLLSAGLTNSEIAGRLVVSVRTADNHVAAVLDKLGAHNRAAAVVRAGELGLDVEATGEN
ncbi:MAG TPA: AAA family ATPase [Kribbella sp.]|nr:AAA family ATPase [Kribbella sp.]